MLFRSLCSGYIAIAYCYKNGYTINNSKQMSAKAKTMSHIIESLEGIEIIKKFCQQEHFYDCGKKKIHNWQNLVVAVGNIENSQSAIKKMLNGIGRIIIICIGSLEVINGRMSIGDMITYNILIGYILSPINDIIYLQPQFHAAQVAMERLNTIMQQIKEYSDGIALSDFKQLEISSMSAAFEKDIHVLENIDFKIMAGEKVAIIGRSGAGKTTLAKLMIKLNFPKSGDILINGINILKVSSNALRQKIAYLSEEDFIFTGSIRSEEHTSEPQSR